MRVKVGVEVCGQFVGVKVGVATQYISVKIFILACIDENNTFQLKFSSSIKTVGATVLGSLWAYSIKTVGVKIFYLASKLLEFLFWAVCGR